MRIPIDEAGSLIIVLVVAAMLQIGVRMREEVGMERRGEKEC